MRIKGEMCVEGYTEDFGSLIKGNNGLVDGNLRMKFGLVVIGGEEGDGGFMRSYGKALGRGPGFN